MTWLERFISWFRREPTPAELAAEAATEAEDAAAGVTDPPWPPQNLAEAIAADPDLAALAKAGNDAGVAAVLNEAHPTERAWRELPRDEFVGWAKGIGLTYKLRVLLRTTAAPAELLAAAEEVLSLETPCLKWLDVRLPSIAAMADTFITAGLLTDAEKAQLLALGTRPACRWEVAGLFAAPTTDQVSAALRPPEGE